MYHGTRYGPISQHVSRFEPNISCLSKYHFIVLYLLQALFCTACMPCWNLELLGNYKTTRSGDGDIQGQACYCEWLELLFIVYV